MTQHDDQLGMIWWNRLTPDERRYWLAVSGTGRPVDAWRAYQSGKPSMNESAGDHDMIIPITQEQRDKHHRDLFPQGFEAWKNGAE